MLRHNLSFGYDLDKTKLAVRVGNTVGNLFIIIYKKGLRSLANPLFTVVGRTGLEPATFGL